VPEEKLSRRLPCSVAPHPAACTRARQLLLELAEAAGLGGKIQAMFEGQHINSTEDRAVLHTALRAPRDAVAHDSGRNVVPEVWSVLDKISSFSGGWGFTVAAVGAATSSAEPRQAPGRTTRSAAALA
jgi:hypothetical protein